MAGMESLASSAAAENESTRRFEGRYLALKIIRSALTINTKRGGVLLSWNSTTQALGHRTLWKEQP